MLNKILLDAGIAGRRILIGIDAPEHDEAHVDDAAVARQHQAAVRRAGTASATADLDRALQRYFWKANLFDRIWPAEMQPGGLPAVEFAEAENDALLIWIDAEEEAVEGDARQQQHRNQKQERLRHAPAETAAAAAIAAAAAHHFAHSVLTTAKDFIEIGRLLAAAAARAPRSLAPRAAAFAPAIAPPPP